MAQRPDETAGPFFSVDGNDFAAFRTADEVEGALEVIDVKNGVYRLFASDGTEFRLTTQREPGPSWAARLHPVLRAVAASPAEERVVVTNDAIGNFADELHAKLRRSLELVPEKKRKLTGGALANASLAELADEFARIYAD
jgi:hypothetical protein